MPPNLISDGMRLSMPELSFAAKSRNVFVNLFSVLLPLGALMLAAGLLLPADLFPRDSGFAPLHTILETFAIVVALQVFGTGWFGTGPRTTAATLLLACVFLVTALLDLGHMLSYVGMPDFVTPNNVHKGILFWLAARYMVAVGLLLMLFTYGREIYLRTSRYLILSVAIMMVAVLFWVLLVHEKALPATFIPGTGLTTFKIWMEYGVIALYGSSAVWCFMRYERGQGQVIRIVGYASAVLAVSELCFTLYASVADTFNVLGHVYKVIGYGMLYRALFISNVREPYRRLEIANQRLREVSEAVSEHFGATLFENLVQELSHQLGMRYVVILEVCQDDSATGRIVALTGGERLKLARGDCHDLQRVPCLNAFKTSKCRIDCNACGKYPEESLLRDLSIQSYIGTELLDSKGDRIGVLAAFDEHPIQDTIPVEELMQIFAARASAELERIRMDAHLHDSERRMRSILTNIQDGVFRTDNDMRLVWVSPSTEKISGYALQELLGSHIEVFHPDRNQHEAFLARLAQEGGDLNGFEMELKMKDGQTRWVSVNAHYYHDENGDVQGIEGVIHDIEARKQAELGLVELNRELELKVEERTRQFREINEELEAFSYSVSHDLRAPLRHVGGFAEILESDFSERLGEEGGMYVERIMRAVRRMSQLIEDLLSLSRITRQDLVLADIDLGLMAEKVLHRLSDQDPGREVETIIMKGVTVSADPKLMRIVLENLIGNAWKFTAQQSSPVIEFGCRVENGHKNFFVRDNGAGFDMRYADRLFTPFQRLHSPEDFEGTGIGLATVERIIRRHGGDIRAESSPGMGATFTFTL